MSVIVILLHLQQVGMVMLDPPYLFVCLFVCLLVGTRVTEKVMGGFHEIWAIGRAETK